MTEPQPPNLQGRHQRTLADTPFPGDDGEPADGIRELLAAAAGDSTSYLRTIAALCAVRLLVPVVATSTEEPTTKAGLTSDKLTSDKLTPDSQAEMAVVLLQTTDGRKAMVAFTGLDTLADWNSEARPVPVTLDLAAGSAKQEGAEALLIDVGGPHPLAIDGPILDELASGHRLVEIGTGQFGWAVPADDASGADKDGTARPRG